MSLFKKIKKQINSFIQTTKSWKNFVLSHNRNLHSPMHAGKRRPYLENSVPSSFINIIHTCQHAISYQYLHNRRLSEY